MANMVKSAKTIALETVSTTRHVTKQMVLAVVVLMDIMGNFVTHVSNFSKTAKAAKQMTDKNVFKPSRNENITNKYDQYS